ncbi:hypothetical protein JAAARDRAFT_31341 [Jaapia argillacea MUCL 33604]|uniref:Protein kinase domain-containing protein n=1 Tax=Jaapia argillacea MUCL 33604 TaxID=933084 RepID=A0A067Q473_9AGAM|nr:hypothetical protein JAAARDRAFT_31341 [Jaapia argillacea MUCL 33604]
MHEIQANEFIGPDYTHITEVIGTATIGGKPAIVMRWYTNGDVAQYTSLNPHSLVDLIISIVQGVKHLHTNDLWVVHSDLQPSNILVDDDGRALISGLGLIYVPGNTVFTTANMSGPCQWMAPEHIVVDEDHNAQPPAPTFQSTMWAVGCTIARLITGKVPYQSRRYSPQVVPLIVRGVLPYIKAGFVDAADAGGVLRSEELWQVLDQCWEKDPTRRPTITQFEASIQGVFDIS